MMASLNGSPGKCWVSTVCYPPRSVLDKWMFPTIASLENLRVFYNTVVVSAQVPADIRCKPP